MTGMSEQKQAEARVRFQALEKELASSMMNGPHTIDLKTAVHNSLETIRDILTEKPNCDEVNMLTEQIEHLLTDQTERLESINRDLEAFNYSVAHDLCAPLRRITGFTKALQEQYSEKLGSEGMDYLDRISRSSRHMNELIEALLQLSQLSYIALKREFVDLSEIVSKAAKELHETAPDRAAEFSIQPCILAFGDANLLEIAINNLLRNAWKFTSMRDFTYIEFGELGVAEGKACFLRDNGIGFEMANSERMFQAFQRLQHGADFPGNGVGLTTVQRIITRHGGRIWAEGELGKGATVYFTLQSSEASRR